MTRLELLAPAKNLQTGMAAIDHGADAVYIGPSQWGARAAAGNSLADIAQLCAYAHQFDVKVYATVNTLIRDDEIPDVTRLLHGLADAGVDAVLVQDMKLLPLFRDLPLALHASTQADNRTPQKVQGLLHQGFRRAVLARELSVAEVAAIHAAVPQMELEVFVHGALCVSYSGLCYASEYCFNRSANRGECAQFCRMQFDLLDATGRELEHQRHLLSLKDLNLSHQLGRLIEAGATSFKIEGRLKDIAYVKNVTAAYSQLLNSYIKNHPGQYERSSRGQCTYTFQPDLNRTFNRGYTTYFADGRQPNQASFFTPKAIGPMVGKVKEMAGTSFTVAGTATFANGDGLCFFDKEHHLQGFRVNRAEGNRLFPQSMPAGMTKGMPLYRSSDQAMERILSKPSAERKIPVVLSLEPAVMDDGATAFRLTIDDGLHQASVIQLAEHQLAKTPQRQNIERELSKLGGTPFVCKAVQLPADFPFFLPASQLATWRRMVVKSLNSLTPGPSPKGEGRDYSQDGKRTENQMESGLLMQCRYCLRHELGYCVKKGGAKPQWKEPLFLRLGDGRRFRLEFDCSRCQMNVYAIDH